MYIYIFIYLFILFIICNILLHNIFCILYNLMLFSFYNCEIYLLHFLYFCPVLFLFFLFHVLLFLICPVLSRMKLRLK